MERKTGSTQKKNVCSNQPIRYQIETKKRQQEKYDETTVQTATKPNDNKYSACGSPFYIVNVGVSGERNLLKIKKKTKQNRKRLLIIMIFFLLFRCCFLEYSFIRSPF